jgi:type I restriction enzyme R subunit
MHLDNFLVRPHRKLVEQYAQWSSWSTLTTHAADEVGESLAGLPSSFKDDDEDAKRFDLLILRRQLAQLKSDAIAAERLREQIQNIATGLLGQTSIPSVAAQQSLLDDVASDEWWVDVTLPMLELVRRRLRGLLQFLEKAKKVVVYTSFQDELSEATLVDLPGITPGTNWQRFRAKAAAYLKQHQDHIALQRLRRNKVLTPEDLRLSNRCSSIAGQATPTTSPKPKKNPTALDCSSDPSWAWTARQPSMHSPHISRAPHSLQNKYGSST